MTAEEFVNNKLGDKNYTHSQYPMYRDEIAQWLNEFLALKQGQNLPISNVVPSALDLLDTESGNGWWQISRGEKTVMLIGDKDSVKKQIKEKYPDWKLDKFLHSA